MSTFFHRAPNRAFLSLRNSLTLACAFWGTATASAIAQNQEPKPPNTHGHLNIFPAAQVAQTGDVKVDGDLSEWKSDAFVSMFADSALRDQFSLRLALAYDNQGLLVAARFNDLSPLVNTVDPRLDPFKAWNGDALQLRFITDAALSHPLPTGMGGSDKIVHLTAWQFSEENLPALDIRYGMDFHAPQTLIGPASGLFFRKVEGGYAMEGRIPFAAIKAAPPQPGHKWLMTMQPLWSNPDGGLQHFFFEVVREATGNALIVILRVLHNAERNLFQVRLAARTAGIFAGASEHGKQDRRKNGDDGDHN